MPDSDNTVARCKAIRDGIADACLVSNDRVLRIGEVTFEKVGKRVEQSVEITVRKVAT